jgi:transposase-like protein
LAPLAKLIYPGHIRTKKDLDMTRQKRRRHNPDFKAKVALEAAKGLKTASQIASEYQISAVQVSQWKQQMMRSLPDLFGTADSVEHANPEELTNPLYQEIGKLKMELDWLKKKLGPLH